MSELRCLWFQTFNKLRLTVDGRFVSIKLRVEYYDDSYWFDKDWL